MHSVDKVDWLWLRWHLHGLVLDDVSLEGVDGHPLESSERSQQLAVVEASSSSDRIISGSSHHRRVDNGSLLVLGVSVVKVVPDPEWTSVVRAEVVSNDQLLTLLVVSVLNLLRSVVKSPLQSLLVDVGAPVSDLISLVEVSLLVTSCLLDRLAGHQLGLDLSGGNWIQAGVEVRESLVEGLRNSDGVELALGLAIALVLDGGQVDWGNGPDLVEVIVGLDRGMLVADVAAHDGLSLGSPLGSVQALGAWRVHQVLLVASRLHAVESLEFHSLEERVEVVDRRREDLVGSGLLLDA